MSIKSLAVKTASEMTYTVSGGALNSAQPQPLKTLECDVNLCNIISVFQHLFVYIFSDLLPVHRLPVRAVTDDDYLCQATELTC